MRPVAAALSWGLLALAVVSGAHGQAIVHPNQIAGDLRITSASPEIVALLEAPGPYGWTVRGTSTTFPQLQASTGVSSPTARAADYELTVEAGAAGTAYDVVASWSGNRAQYVFEEAESDPVLREPEPDVRLDFSECAGLVRIRLPAGATSARAEAHAPSARWGTIMQARVTASDPVGPWLSLVARGEDTPHRIVVRYTVGTDAAVDLVTLEKTFDIVLRCDEVVEVDCSGGTGGSGFALGAIAGRVDVLGEDEVRLDAPPSTVVVAENGPWGNSRYTWMDRVPSSGDFLLPNLVSSDEVAPSLPYRVETTLRLRSGRRYQFLRLPRASVHVPRGTTVDIGDTFVVDPGYVAGDIRLAGPPERTPLGPIWSHLWRRSDDTDGDGIPLLADGRGGTQALASTQPWSSLTSGDGLAAAEIDGGPDGTTDWRGRYELVLGGLNRASQEWNAGILAVSAAAPEQPGVPGSFLSSTATIEEPARRDMLIEPGSRFDVPLRYCFSRVDVAFVATAGTFYAPSLQDTSTGSFRGPVDFEGRQGTSYQVEVVARGTPATRADAAAVGNVTALVPQGSYAMRPQVIAVNPGGGTSATEILPFLLDVGCREEIVVHPELGVDLSVSPVPPCAGDLPVRVAGRVRGLEPVASIAWSVDGGASGTACTACGMNPTFAVDVPLVAGDNRIVVTATDVSGRVASVTGHSRASREPSALDLRPGSTPLTVRRVAASTLELAWEDRPGEQASAYQGTLASLHGPGRYDHRGIGACGLGSSIRIDVPASDAYFLVGDACAWGDGSLGRDSRGVERAAAVDPCR